MLITVCCDTMAREVTGLPRRMEFELDEVRDGLVFVVPQTAFLGEGPFCLSDGFFLCDPESGIKLSDESLAACRAISASEHAHG